MEKRDILSDRETMLMAFDHLGPIEQRIMCVMVQRIGDGQCNYGRFKDDDPRHEPDEMFEEVVDALVYAGKKLVKQAKKYAAASLDRKTDPCPDPEISCNWEE